MPSSCRVVILFSVLVWSVRVTAAAQPPISLYPGIAPGSEEWRQEEVQQEWGDQRIIRNVVQPMLLPYPADVGDRLAPAVIIAPGGGFRFLSIDQEGTYVANWLNQRGIHAYVLKYRTEETASSKLGFFWQGISMFVAPVIRSWFSGNEGGKRPYPSGELAPVQSLAIKDGLCAVALVRQRSADWGVQPGAIGMLGFSAGGAVATGVALHGRGDSRPDFVAALYGVPAPGEPPEHGPPLLLMATQDDPIIPPNWNRELYRRWEQAGLSATLREYSEGGHGFGMRQ